MNSPTFKYVFTPEDAPGESDLVPQPSLRGDSELWRYLGATLYNIPIPRDAAVALQLVKDTVTNFTGWDCQPSAEESFEVSLSRFQGGTGMSTGHASITWWLERGFPAIAKLIARELDTYDSWREASD